MVKCETVTVEYKKTGGLWSYHIDPHIKTGVTELKYHGEGYPSRATCKRDADKILRQWNGKHKIIVKR